MPAPGDLFARRYRLGPVLGRGAMGVVHEAVHEALGHRVAIKMLRGGLADDEHAVRRFEREARLAAKLDSPHVVRVFDVDRIDDGAPYLVMERLVGRDLATEVDAREAEGPIPISIAVAWACAIAEAMHAAHEAGIVHRDLKLSNVFLTNDGVVKVLDFGVASFRGGDGDSTATASVAGTPRYMAPEQLLGEAPNPASDVWAVGVLLYRLLTGRFPYDAATMAAQMLAIMEGEPRIDAVAPRVPRALANVVHRALGRTLEERCPSMADLRTALAPFERATTLEGDANRLAETPDAAQSARGDRAPAESAQASALRASAPAAPTRDDDRGEEFPSRARRASRARRWFAALALALATAAVVGMAIVLSLRASPHAPPRPLSSAQAVSPLDRSASPAVSYAPSATGPEPAPSAVASSPAPEPRGSPTPRWVSPARPSSSAGVSAPPSGDGFPNHL